MTLQGSDKISIATNQVRRHDANASFRYTSLQIYINPLSPGIRTRSSISLPSHKPLTCATYSYSKTALLSSQLH
jgi:hypothetical protein